MAKSAGTMFLLRDLEEKNIDPLAFRYLILTAHYRTKLNFTWESLEAATQSFSRLQDFIRELQSAKKISNGKSLEIFQKEFEQSITNDLDTPKAVGTIWKLFHTYHKNPADYDPKAILKLLYQWDEILGIRLKQIKKI